MSLVPRSESTQLTGATGAYIPFARYVMCDSTHYLMPSQGAALHARTLLDCLTSLRMLPTLWEHALEHSAALILMQEACLLFVLGIQMKYRRLVRQACMSCMTPWPASLLYFTPYCLAE